MRMSEGQREYSIEGAYLDNITILTYHGATTGRTKVNIYVAIVLQAGRCVDQ